MTLHNFSYRLDHVTSGLKITLYFGATQAFVSQKTHHKNQPFCPQKQLSCISGICCSKLEVISGHVLKTNPGVHLSVASKVCSVGAV